MGLVISRGIDESYFLLANRQINPGEYIEIKRIQIRKDYSGPIAKDLIAAPMGVVILREELVDEIGGLEEVIKQMKEGVFKFKEKNG